MILLDELTPRSVNPSLEAMKSWLSHPKTQFLALNRGKAPIAPPSPGLTPFVLHEAQAHITFLCVLNFCSVNPSNGAMVMASFP